MTHPVTFGAYLRGLREAKGLSVRQLAGQIGIEPSYLSKIERDENSPKEAVLEALAGVLETNPHILLAMAGKVSRAFQEALQRYPEEFAMILGRLAQAPKQEVARTARAVRDGNW